MSKLDSDYVLAVLAPLLAQVEGPCVTEGYIPARPGNFYGRKSQDPSDYVAIGASGVTIATGCDLGQTSADVLRGYGCPENIIRQFSPYIGYKTSRAILRLSSKPLRITADEAKQVDAAVHLGYLLRYVKPAYEKASGTRWEDLPDRAAAVIFSCCFQKGCGGVRKDWPKLWGHFVQQDWQAAYTELNTGFTQYKLRRATEARWLGGML